MELGDFETRTFAFEGTRWNVLRRGEGPGVLIMHEIPGITPAVAGFARRVADEGFSVALPQLFGDVPQTDTPLTQTREMARACIGREFSVLARGQASPITRPLLALCRELHQERGGPGVGAIGMCITGNFALALMVDGPVLAPVLSQPSLPLGITAAHRADPHLDEAGLQAVERRCREEDLSVLGLRFTQDPLCPAARFSFLRQRLGDRFEGIEIDSSPGNPWGIPRRAHSVLTRDLVDEEGHPTQQALQRVLGFLRSRLPAGR